MNTGPFWDYVLEKGINTKRKMVKRYGLHTRDRGDSFGFDHGDGGGNGYLSRCYLSPRHEYETGLASCGLGRGTVSM